MKQRISAFLVMVLTAAGLVISGCETEAQNKALIGGAVGAAAGQAIGRDTEGTLIGAGIGAGAGYLWGKSQDNKAEKEKEQAAAATRTAPNDANTITVWVNNSNGSQTPVKLTRNADGTYTGPKGERYAAMPTDEQLKTAYGF